MKRDIFEPEHLVFRDTVRQFLTRHVLPHHASWEQAGMVERWVWKAAAEQGLLGLQAEEAYGGGGIDDFRFNVILDEAAASDCRGPAAGADAQTPVMMPAQRAGR